MPNVNNHKKRIQKNPQHYQLSTIRHISIPFSTHQRPPNLSDLEIPIYPGDPTYKHSRRYASLVISQVRDKNY